MEPSGKLTKIRYALSVIYKNLMTLFQLINMERIIEFLDVLYVRNATTKKRKYLQKLEKNTKRNIQEKK